MKGELKGELTASEIRKLIRAHNKLLLLKNAKYISFLSFFFNS